MDQVLVRTAYSGDAQAMLSELRDEFDGIEFDVYDLLDGRTDSPFAVMVMQSERHSPSTLAEVKRHLRAWIRGRAGGYMVLGLCVLDLLKRGTGNYDAARECIGRVSRRGARAWCAYAEQLGARPRPSFLEGVKAKA